jgi:flagellar motor protein MotB
VNGRLALLTRALLWDYSNMSEEQAPNIAGAGKDQQPKTYVPSPTGSESTREMREVSRRRRDAEEKLQQHLQEADQLHEAHVQAHLKETQQHSAATTEASAAGEERQKPVE